MDRIPEVFYEYVAMWRNYVNFDDRTNVRGYWMAFLWHCVVVAFLGALGGIAASSLLSTLYALGSLIPGIAITIRRLRDMGKPWQSIFFALIPIAGFILMIIWLSKPSVADDGTPVV